jgi:hypothetical protein
MKHRKEIEKEIENRLAKKEKTQRKRDWEKQKQKEYRDWKKKVMARSLY